MLVASYGVAALKGLQGHDGLGGADTYLGSPKTRVASQAKVAHPAMWELFVLICQFIIIIIYRLAQ